MKKNMMLRSDLKSIDNSSREAMLACLTCGIGNMPTTEVTTITGEAPMNTSDALAFFSDDMSILGESHPGVATDQTLGFGGSSGTSLQTDLLLFGYGLHVSVEPISFSAHANSWTPPVPVPPAVAGPYSAPASLDVFTDRDVVNAGVAGPAAGLTAAYLSWGQPAWLAMAHFLQAYRFQWIVGGRDIVVDEPLVDVAYFTGADGAEGFGTSEVAVLPYFRQVNERLRLLGQPQIALPITHRRYGSSSALGGASLYHPTRDYETAPASWGSSIAGCCDMPFRKFRSPCFLERNVPINIGLVRSNDYHYDELIRNLSVTENGSSGPTGFYPDALMGPSVAGIPELSSDTGAAVTTVVQQNRIPFKGGAWQISFFLKGLEIPRVCREPLFDICTMAGSSVGGIWNPAAGGIMRRDGSVMALNGQPVGSQVVHGG